MLREDCILSGETAAHAVVSRDLERLLDPDTTLAERVRLLQALSAGRPSAERLAAVAGILRRRGQRVSGFEDRATDLCGTGGDRSGTFNISTAAAFVAAAAGVVVAKHGNRSVSSHSGSSDCLEALGVSSHCSAKSCRRMLQAAGMAFMFAPRFHPAMATVMTARRVLARRGIKTLFNVVGPLINPAAVRRQTVGVYDRALLQPVAGALRLLGVRSAVVLCGNGLDEATLDGETHMVILRHGRLQRRVLRAADHGFRPCPPADLTARDAPASAATVRGVLEGTLRDARRDVVVLNAALAIQVGATDEPGLPEALQRARGAIESGAALRKLHEVQRLSCSLEGDSIGRAATRHPAAESRGTPATGDTIAGQRLGRSSS